MGEPLLRTGINLMESIIQEKFDVSFGYSIVLYN